MLKIVSWRIERTQEARIAFPIGVVCLILRWEMCLLLYMKLCAYPGFETFYSSLFFFEVRCVLCLRYNGFS